MNLPSLKMHPMQQHSEQPSSEGKKRFFALLVCFLAALAGVTICSKSSPLYPFNDWVDVNCFMTVGRGILKGLVPYRDLYEQKGPLLYMLFAVFSLIGDAAEHFSEINVFFGVYLGEVAAGTFFLYATYRILRIHRGLLSLPAVVVLAAMVYTSKNFSHGGSAEEFCLPLIAWSMYLGLDALSRKDVPSNAGCVCLGICGAAVLWVKYTMLGFYIGWVLVPVVLLLVQKKFLRLLQCIGFVLLGAAIVTVPILIYFAANGALNDLFQVYFYDNIFLYKKENSEVSSSELYYVGQGIKSWMNLHYILFSAMLAGVAVWLVRLPLKDGPNIAEILQYLITLAFTVFFVYMGGRLYSYYGLVLFVFAFPGFEMILWFLSVFGHLALRLFKKLRENASVRAFGVWLCAIVTVLCLAGAGLYERNTTSNAYMMFDSRENLPQYIFAEYMKDYPDSTLLNYGFLDGGFYLASGKLPVFPYFCTLNLNSSEMKSELKRYISEGLVDFVVTRNNPSSLDGYKLVAQAEYYFEGKTRTYNLFQKE